MAGGRPKSEVATRLPANWRERMLELAADGASAVELRCEVGRISVDLWDRWIREDPQYSETVKECKALCEMWWEKQGRKMAAGTADGNATVWIFNMKNRFGWKDKTETEHSGTIAFSDMTDEQIERRIAALKTGKD